MSKFGMVLASATQRSNLGVSPKPTTVKIEHRDLAVAQGNLCAQFFRARVRVCVCVCVCMCVCVCVLGGVEKKREERRKKKKCIFAYTLPSKYITVNNPLVQHFKDLNK